MEKEEVEVKKAKDRKIRACEYSDEQEMFIRYMNDRHKLSYSAVTRMGISLLMKKYNVE
jgi:hypothetical protein